MKKLVIGLVVMFLAMPVMAEGLSDLFDKLPNVKQGIAWDLESDELLTTTTCDVLNYKKKVSLGGGIATDFDDYTYPIAEICYKIGGLEDLGFNYPLEEYVKLEVKAFGGREFNTDDKLWHYGVGLGVFDVKF